MSFGFERFYYEMPKSRYEIKTIVGEHNQELVERISAAGLKQVPIENSTILAENINHALKNFINENPYLISKVRFVIFSHSLPFVSLNGYDFLGNTFRGSGFEKSPKFAITGMPCAILHKAVEIAGKMLNGFDDDSGIIVIGADKAYSFKERIYFNTIMGDSIFIGFLTKKNNNFKVLSSYIDTNLIAIDGENSPQKKIEEFRANNPYFIRNSIEMCLSKVGISIDSLKYLIPHTPNNAIWDMMSNVLKIDRKKIFTKYISETGHLNSNDSFIHFARAINEGFINEGDMSLLVNPGFGGTRGCTLIQY